MKIISLELLVHFKDLLTSGKLIPYQSRTLSQKLPADKLPDGVPTQVIEVLQESNNPATSSAIIKAIDDAIREFSSSLGTVSSKLILSIGGTLYEYNPAKALELRFKEPSAVEAGFIIDSNGVGISIPLAGSSNGLMSSEDKTKLDQLEVLTEITTYQVKDLFKDW